MAPPVVALRNELGEGHQQHHLPQLRGLEGSGGADLIPAEDAAGVHLDHQQQRQQDADHQIGHLDEGFVLVVIEKGDGHGDHQGDEDADQLPVEVFKIQAAQKALQSHLRAVEGVGEHIKQGDKAKKEQHRHQQYDDDVHAFGLLGLARLSHYTGCTPGPLRARQHSRKASFQHFQSILVKDHKGRN